MAHETTARAAVLLADGFEEIEAITVIDVLRRAGVAVTTLRLGDNPVRGAHGIAVLADDDLDAAGDGAAFGAVVLPGGMPGSARLRDDERVLRLVRSAASAGRVVAAICAAPIALAAAGVLEGRRATSYPGFELPGARRSDERVVVDDRVVTSRGPGTALDFALALVSELVSPAEAAKLRESMQVG
ncbi:MAG: DJ-1/PfpI family protein [Polyangiaceae bacterium]|nr:DJ-1/PfpI family protein [Polyangiaceae bacterium]